MTRRSFFGAVVQAAVVVAAAPLVELLPAPAAAAGFGPLVFKGVPIVFDFYGKDGACVVLNKALWRRVGADVSQR